MAERCKFKTTVGGQAVMEGIMMRGPQKWCLSVRTPNGEIVTEEHENKKSSPLVKIPFVRGVVSFVSSLTMGYKTLMRSAELSMTEEEQEAELSNFDRWVEKKFGDKAMNVVMGISAFLGLVLAVVLFMFLPTFLVNLVNNHLIALGGFKALLEGLFKIALFVLYLAVVRNSKEIRRVFGYHGAEHKTIFCYEAGDELTVENIRKHTRFHPRCGTSFLLIVLIISILLFSVIPWTGMALRVVLKILLLPVVMGASYEVIRLAGRYDNIVTRIVSAPGLWLQRLTTCEPDDSMIEVAIAAVTPVLPQNPEEAKW
ncbi:DUF1385 domain-containing protein [Ruminococcaceae bacterium OttesenSCG-928-A16]|nr:DUF1385 domain-containing protein [Ruminococcaceae bacterium OttesenSCG-928-A16]